MLKVSLWALGLAAVSQPWLCFHFVEQEEQMISLILIPHISTVFNTMFRGQVHVCCSLECYMMDTLLSPLHVQPVANTNAVTTLALSLYVCLSVILCLLL